MKPQGFCATRTMSILERFCSVILLVIPLCANSQENHTESSSRFNHFLEVGLGLNYHGVRDLGTSPLTYKGTLPTIHIQYFFRNQKFIGSVEEDFSVGYLKTRNYKEVDHNRAMSFNNELSFNGLFIVKNFKNITIGTGGELGTFADVRLNDKFNNANLNYEIMGYLAPSAMIEYRTSWKARKVNIGILTFNRRDRELNLQYCLTLPVITDILRPGFVTINNFVDDNSYSVEPDNLKLVSFNHFFMIRNKFTAYYILHNNNMLKFNYYLNYFSYYNHYNPVKGFNSAFLLSIVFRFTNN